MRAGIVFGLVIVAAACTTACSSSSGGPLASADAGWDCNEYPDLPPFDVTHDCLGQPLRVIGLCERRAGGIPTSGLESVCAVDSSGDLFLLEVATDMELMGDGWTFGPRAAPAVVHAGDTLSPVDDARCRQAQAEMLTTKSCAAGDGGPDQ